MKIKRWLPGVLLVVFALFAASCGGLFGVRGVLFALRVLECTDHVE